MDSKLRTSGSSILFVILNIAFTLLASAIFFFAFSEQVNAQPFISVTPIASGWSDSGNSAAVQSPRDLRALVAQIFLMMDYGVRRIPVLDRYDFSNGTPPAGMELVIRVDAQELAISEIFRVLGQTLPATFGGNAVLGAAMGSFGSQFSPQLAYTRLIYDTYRVVSESSSPYRLGEIVDGQPYFTANLIPYIELPISGDLDRIAADDAQRLLTTLNETPRADRAQTSIVFVNVGQTSNWDDKVGQWIDTNHRPLGLRILNQFMNMSVDELSRYGVDAGNFRFRLYQDQTGTLQFHKRPGFSPVVQTLAELKATPGFHDQVRRKIANPCDGVADFTP